MISINVKNINEFMNSLLAKDTFDSFLVSELEITAANTFTINGRLNKSFYNEEELSLLNDDFISWASLRHICYEIIKGKKVPSKIKITFQLPNDSIEKMLGHTDTDYSLEQVLGMYMHVTFENNLITIITGTSLNIFTLDKTLDKYWDKQITSILDKEFDIEIL